MKLTYATIALSFATAAPLASGQLTEDFRLLGTDTAADDHFGFSVGVSGTTAIVGAYGDGHIDGYVVENGAVYVFDMTTGQQLFKLIPSDLSQGDSFGLSVAIDGTTAIVGAPYASQNDDGAGVAYLFDTTTGQQLRKFSAGDGALSEHFGFSVAISGTIAVVGARFDDAGIGFGTGAAYVIDTTTGQQLFKLTASDAADHSQFGSSVAISGTTVVVGTRGLDGEAAYVFDATTGQQLFELIPDSGNARNFGYSVAISETTAVVGTGANNTHGSAHVFDASTGQWLFELSRPGVHAQAEFGSSVAVSGDIILVGEAWGGDGVEGAAHAFDAGTGQWLYRLESSDLADLWVFGNAGRSVGLSDGVAIIGAPRAEYAGEESGAAYTFELPAAPCYGDIADDFGTLGSDGMVSFGDFLAMLGLVGPCPRGVPGCTGDIADDFGIIGYDGMVSFGDFLALLGLIGPCP